MAPALPGTPTPGSNRPVLGNPSGVSFSTFTCAPVLFQSFRRVWLFATPWTVALQAPLSMGVSRHEYWSGLPCPPPGDLPNPGIEPMSLVSPALAGGFFTTVPPGKPISLCVHIYAYIFSFRFFSIIFNSLCLFLCIRYINYIS